MRSASWHENQRLFSGVKARTNRRTVNPNHKTFKLISNGLKRKIWKITVFDVVCHHIRRFFTSNIDRQYLENPAGYSEHSRASRVLVRSPQNCFQQAFSTGKCSVTHSKFVAGTFSIFSTLCWPIWFPHLSLIKHV